MKYKALPPRHAKQLKALSACVFGETYSRKRYLYRVRCKCDNTDVEHTRADEAIRFYTAHLRHPSSRIDIRRDYEPRVELGLAESERQLRDASTLGCLVRGGLATVKVADAIGISPAQARRDLQRLAQQGRIEQVTAGGPGRGHAAIWERVP